MKKNIIILTELGKRNSGSGHFLRSLILKKTLNSKNCKLLIQNNKNIKKNLISNYKDLHLINQESNARKFVKKDHKNILVIDKYRTNFKYFKNLAKFFYKIVIFDDLEFSKNLKTEFCYIYPQKIKKLNIGKNYIEGHTIFPVDKNIIQTRRKYKIKKSIRNIFLFFGGAVNRKKIEETLFKISQLFPKKIKFFLYNSYKINQKKIPENFTLIKSNKSYFKQLPKYDAGIITSGFIKFDLLTIGMPIIYIPMYYHQIKIAKYYSKNNIGLDLGYYKNLDSKKKDIKDIIKKYLFPYGKRYKYFKYYRSKFDGKGVERIKKYLLEL